MAGKWTRVASFLAEPCSKERLNFIKFDYKRKVTSQIFNIFYLFFEKNKKNFENHWICANFFFLVTKNKSKTKKLIFVKQWIVWQQARVLKRSKLSIKIRFSKSIQFRTGFQLLDRMETWSRGTHNRSLENFKRWKSRFIKIRKFFDIPEMVKLVDISI